MAFDSIKKFEDFVSASHPPKGEKIELDPIRTHICAKEIRGSWGGGVSPDRDIPENCAPREKKFPSLPPFVGSDLRTGRNKCSDL